MAARRPGDGPNRCSRPLAPPTPNEAWVVTRDQVVDEGWFGPRVGSEARRRLGDVALVPFEPVAYHDPDDSGPFQLIGRHGSLTRAEMHVPLLVAML